MSGKSEQKNDTFNPLTSNVGSATIGLPVIDEKGSPVKKVQEVWLPKTKHQTDIALAVFWRAWVHGDHFTFSSFCSMYGFKANRHTRAVLDCMVEARALHMKKILYRDGHVRDVFSASQQTQMKIVTDANGVTIFQIL